MLRYKSPIVPSLNLQNYDRRSTKNRSSLRSQQTIKLKGKRPSNHSVTSDVPKKQSRRGQSITMAPNPAGGYTTTFQAQKSSISSQENTNIAILNLKDFSARKGSQNITIASDSGRLRAALQLESNRDEALPVKLDTSEFQTQFKFADHLKEEDFGVLRIMIAKRKE